MIEFSEQKFQEWLRLKGGGWVGAACEPCSCPLANFLRQEYFAVYVSVTETTIEVNDHSEPTPDWARDFILEVDRGGEGEVTGDDCLGFLSRA